MLHVGLTGNIASGKSYVTSLFAELGAYVIDADNVVHDLLNRGTTTYDKIVLEFGKQILDQGGAIDRKKLAQIVFFDEGKRRRLNALTHPEVGAEISRRILEHESSASNGIIIVDAALMVETGGYKQYDCLIVIFCDPPLQMSRLMSRDGLTEKDARARMTSQMPIEEKIKLADYVIDNSGTLQQTKERTETVYRDLLIRERNKNEGREQV
jgi:dephospho-CoA kinase